jgi:hypothetical protein
VMQSITKPTGSMANTFTINKKGEVVSKHVIIYEKKARMRCLDGEWKKNIRGWCTTVRTS